MRKNSITKDSIRYFEIHLRDNEKAESTIQKYVKEIINLKIFLKNGKLTKKSLLQYRDILQVGHKATTVNNKLSAINAYLRFLGRRDCEVKFLKVQHRAFIEGNRELTEAEYRRLLSAAKQRKNKRLYYLLLTVCATGIRISELKYITMEALRTGRADIRMKGKSRTVILPKDLARKLEEYAHQQHILEGMIFQTRSGNPLDRSNIWNEMKALSKAANINPQKVYPHNLRHLFARSFYSIEKNLSHLADILGHSSIETTRIYVAVSVEEHEKTIKKMKLII